MKKLEYNHDTNLVSGSNNYSMHPLFFMPKEEDLIPYASEAIRNKNKDFQFFDTYNVWPAVNNIIRNFYNKSEHDGEINIQYLHKVLLNIANLNDKIKFWKHALTTNLDTYKRQGVMFKESSFKEEDCIGYGFLSEDFESGDNDCYETAGGYRSYLAEKGTAVYFFITKDLKVLCRVESSLIVDHYNNNIAGVSTGGGTTKYEIGEKLATRGILLEPDKIFYTMDSRENKDFKIRLDVSVICPEKVLSEIKKKQPELAEVNFKS